MGLWLNWKAPKEVKELALEAYNIMQEKDSFLYNSLKKSGYEVLGMGSSRVALGRDLVPFVVKVSSASKRILGYSNGNYAEFINFLVVQKAKVDHLFNPTWAYGEVPGGTFVIADKIVVGESVHGSSTKEIEKPLVALVGKLEFRWDGGRWDNRWRTIEADSVYGSINSPFDFQRANFGYTKDNKPVLLDYGFGLREPNAEQPTLFFAQKVAA